MLLKSLLGCVVAGMFAFSPSFAMAAVPEVKPDKDFQGIGISVTTSGNISVFAAVRDIGGKVAVCGFVFFEKSTATTRAVEPKFTDQIRFSIAGKALSVNSRVFKRYKTEEEAFAGNARCAVTLTPWAEAYGKAKLSMKLGTVEIRY